MAIQVNPIVSPRIITVPETDGNSITIQSLVNQIRAWEDDQANLCYPRLLSASGKEDLGNEVLVGITAMLENAKVKFEERDSPTVCAISGGNLVAVDMYEQAMYPIEPSNNVTVILAQSSSATMIETGVSGLTEEESIQLMSIPIDPLKNDVVAIKSETDKIEEMHLNLIDMLSDTAFIRKVEGGKWEISGNQMVFYDEDNLTEIMRFNITEDESGNPIMRTRV